MIAVNGGRTTDFDLTVACSRQDELTTAVPLNRSDFVHVTFQAGEGVSTNACIPQLDSEILAATNDDALQERKSAVNGFSPILK